MIPPASRMSTVSYSIRRVVAEARKAEAAGKRIHYLNTGDPCGVRVSRRPRTWSRLYSKSLRDGENGYGPSVGLPASARGGRRREHGARMAASTPTASS